jgi:hypothetical protein
MLKLIPTPEARAARAAARAYAPEVRYYARVLQSKLTQLGLCYRFPKSAKDFLSSGVQKIQFTQAFCQDDAIWLQVDSLRLPRDVTLAAINQAEVLEDLSVACEREVRFKRDTAAGAFLVVYRDGAIAGIPSKITFDEAMSAYPAKAAPLTVPLGVTHNRRLLFRSLAEFPHALIGGATDSGKTTMQHTILCALLQKNDPSALRLGLVDLKGGTEFTRYKALPHVLAFVKEHSGVGELLESFKLEMDTRLDLFEQRGGIQNIAQYNSRFPPLPRWLLMVDELSSVMMDAGMKKDAVRLLTDITERGRAAGIHCVLATQRPVVRVVDGQIKGNLEARFAFRTADDVSSQVLLDDASAGRLGDDAPRGRYIFKRGLERIEIQAPLIEPPQIARIVKEAAAGPAAADDELLTDEKIFAIALDELGGSFSRRRLYPRLMGHIGMATLKSLGEKYENQEIIIRGEKYILRPGIGKNPRYLEPLGGGTGENTDPRPTTHNETEEENDE